MLLTFKIGMVEDVEDVIIRELKDIEEFAKCEEIQRQAWGMEDIEIVPLHLLITVPKAGGIVIGAFNKKDGVLIGFCFGFIGHDGERFYLHSHMNAVIPEKQNKGIGRLLKLKQRECTLQRGLNLIKWTFDPLEGLNANLNFRKLGVISRTYIRNCYGEMRDKRNIGLETDRLLVEWWIKSKRVEERIKGNFPNYSLEKLLSKNASIANETMPIKPNFRKITKINTDLTSETILIEIPENIQKIKATNMKLARDWRLKTRELFETYFRKGYVAIDFLSEKIDDQRRNFYILSKKLVLGNEDIPRNFIERS